MSTPNSTDSAGGPDSTIVLRTMPGSSTPNQPLSDDAASASAPPTQFTLVKAHIKAQIVEQLRIPVAVISSTAFPALAFLFFVFPQEAVISKPGLALMSIAQLAMFGVMSAFLFGYGIGVAEDRANPWSTYLRTLPAGPFPGTVARALTAMMFSIFALIPVFVLGGLLTSAPDAFMDGTMSWWRVPVTLITLLVSGLPFLAMGLTVGYLCTSKVAIAVVQLLFFPMAFAGGMMLPPMLFPNWLDAFSLFLPSRAARDLSVEILTGKGLHASTLPVLIIWFVGLAALALWANRRDQGWRFR